MVGNVCALWPQLLHLLQGCGDLFEIVYKRLPSLFMGIGINASQAENVGRVEDGEKADSLWSFSKATVLFAELKLFVDEGVGRRCPEADDDPRSKNLQLPF